MDTGQLAVGLVLVLVVVGGILYYQAQARAAATDAYNRSLGGSIANTIGDVGSIVGAAIGLAGNGGGGQ